MRWRDRDMTAQNLTSKKSYFGSYIRYRIFKNKNLLILSFVFSAIYAGWAGGLYAHYLRFITPTLFNLGKSSELVITTVLGGLGSLTGSVLGTLIVQILPEIFRSMSEYRMLFYGIAVVLVILLRPNGLCGYWEFSLTRLVQKIRNIGKKTAKENSHE